jgi:hypothetical protein
MDNIEIITSVRYKYQQGDRIDTKDIQATLPLFHSTVNVLARLGSAFQLAEFEIQKMIRDLEGWLKHRADGGQSGG